MYGGSGASPAGLTRQPEPPAALAQVLEELDGGPRRHARPQAPRRSRERLPHVAVAAARGGAPRPRPARSLAACSRAGSTRVSFTTTSVPRELVRRGRESARARLAPSGGRRRAAASRRGARADAARSAPAEARNQARTSSSDIRDKVRAAPPWIATPSKEPGCASPSRRGASPTGAPSRRCSERARAGLEALAVTTAELEAGDARAARDGRPGGLREEVLPGARHLAEVRGLSGQTIRRLERIQSDLGDRAQGARRGSRAARRPRSPPAGAASSGGSTGSSACSTGSSARWRTGLPPLGLPHRAQARRVGSVRPPAGSRSSNREPRPSSDSSAARRRAPGRAPARSGARGRSRHRARDQNGRKMRSRSFGPMPGPESATADGDGAVVAASPSSISAAVGRPGEGVVEQVGDDLENAVAVGRDDRVGTERALVLDPAAPRLLAEALVGLLEEPCELDLLLLEGELVAPPCAQGRARRRRGGPGGRSRRSITSSEASRASASSARPSRSASTWPRIAVNGVRSSCETTMRKFRSRRCDSASRLRHLARSGRSDGRSRRSERASGSSAS